MFDDILEYKDLFVPVDNKIEKVVWDTGTQPEVWNDGSNPEYWNENSA